MKTRSLVWLALSLPVAGCFMGYDSRWGQAKAAQQHAAQAATPADISADGDAPPARARTMRVRVYATAGYAAQTLDWRRQVRDTFDDANGVLAPALGVRLEPEGFDAWDARGAEADLHAALGALEARDGATDVDWVCGFIAGMPMATDSFHDAGMGEELGRHLVVRARSVEAEAAVDKAFAGLDEDARERLVKARRRHRAMALVLHELGHTLGAIHDTDEESLMFPRYGTKAAAYREEDVALMKVGLAHRGEASRTTLAKDLLAVYEENGAARWLPAEREEMVGTLEKWGAPAAPPPATAATPDPALAALTDVDRALYAQAAAALKAGDAPAADLAARPLYDRYPGVAPVQDLRCKIAMQSGAAFDAVRAECDPIMKLTTGAR
jgi:hypothetical protein